LLFILLPLLSAEAADLYVDSDCTNGLTTYVPATQACTGGSAKVYSTIQNAANVVVAGDVVYVRSGTYGNVWINGKNGAADAWITFTPYPGETVTIDGYSNAYANGTNDWTVTDCTYIVIDGFILTSSDPKIDSALFAQYSQTLSNSGFKIEGTSNYVHIDHNTIYHTGGGGFLTTHNAEYIQIHGNLIYDVGLSHRGYGMYLQGQHYTVSGNTVVHSYGHGIHVYNEEADQPGYYIIEKNVIYNNGHNDYGAGYIPPYDEDGQTFGCGIIAVLGSDDQSTIIRNNIVYDNLQSGIRVEANGAKVYNNTVYSNDDYGIYVSNWWTNPVLSRNNILYLNTDGNSFGTSTQDHNLTTDPSFVNAPTDFYLLSSSSAIGTGATLTEVTTDIDGTARPQGTGYDIGAYEYVGPPASLVGWWKYDESSGTNANDSSATGADATLTNGPTWTTGRDANAIQFDGADDYVTASNSAFNNLAQFTYSAWVYPTGYGEGNFGRIWSRESADSDYFRCVISIDPGNGTFECRIKSTTAEFRTYSIAGVLPLNTWTHVIAAYDNTGDRKMHLYKDGYEVTYTAQPSLTGTLKPEATALLVGNRLTTTRAFAGKIDDVRIYNTSMTTSEALALFQSYSSNEVGFPAAPSMGFISSVGNFTATSFSGLSSLNASSTPGGFDAGAFPASSSINFVSQTGGFGAVPFSGVSAISLISDIKKGGVLLLF
jgi:parallel beta-helix repeat protein